MSLCSSESELPAVAALVAVFWHMMFWLLNLLSLAAFLLD